MAIALLTTYLTAYRMPLYQRLADEHGVEVLCYGGGERYAPAWFRDLDRQLDVAPFPARRLHGAAEAFGVGASYDAVIAPFAGGAILPAAYAGARRHSRPFVLWASVWAQPRSLTHDVALPVTRHIYRHADAVIAYGEHARRFVARIRGRDSDVFVAPQSVEPELFGRRVSADEIVAFRAAHQLGDGPLVLYAGRLVPEKGVGVLLDAWSRVDGDATLVLVGDGALAERARGVRGRAPARRAAAAGAARRVCGVRADRARVDPDAALSRAVGTRLQRVDAPGPSGDRQRRRRRRRRRPRARRRDRARGARGRRGSTGGGDPPAARRRRAARAARRRGARRRRSLHLRGDGLGVRARAGDRVQAVAARRGPSAAG